MKLVLAAVLALITLSFATASEEAQAEVVALPPSNATIDVMVAQLDDDEFSTREQASAALLKAGAAAEAALKRAIEKPRSIEQKVRALQLLKGIGVESVFKDVEGGAVVAGLQLTLAPQQKSFKAGEPVLLDVRVKNVSDAGVDCVPLQKVDIKSPHKDASSNESQGLLTIRKLKATLEDASDDRGTSVSFGFDRRYEPPAAESLAPGKYLKLTVTIDGDHALNAGEYEAEVSYHAASREMVKGASADVVSNTVKFSVK